MVVYFGVFIDTAKALAFYEESVKLVISNLQELSDTVPKWMEKCLHHFVGVNRTIACFEGLLRTQYCINSNEREMPLQIIISRYIILLL